MKELNQEMRVCKYKKRMKKHALFSVVADMLPSKAGMNKNEKTMLEVIDYVLAPALHSFVAWVLQEAMQQGIKRLYFLARDGYFMYLTAQTYVEKYSLPVECRYLYCSRFSVRVPNYHRNLSSALDYITLGGLHVTPERIYERAGLDLLQRKKMYNEKLLDLEKDTKLSKKKLSEIRDVLENNTLFMDMLQENSKKAFPAYEQYLKQEGMLEEIPMALVDSGWVGSMQRELNLSLKAMGKKKTLKGFYWGLYEIPKDTKEEEYFTYYFSQQGNIKRKIKFNNCLFECIFTAPHGMTLKYEVTEKNIEPVLDNMQEKRKKDVKQMEKALQEWQQIFFERIKGKSKQEVLKSLAGKETLKMISENLEQFMHYPTKAEARAFGNLEFTDDVLEKKENRIATRLNRQELMQNHLGGRILLYILKKQEILHQSAWYEGSAVMYGKYSRYHILGYSCYKYLMHYKKEIMWRKQYEEDK